MFTLGLSLSYNLNFHSCPPPPAPPAEVGHFYGGDRARGRAPALHGGRRWVTLHFPVSASCVHGVPPGMLLPTRSMDRLLTHSLVSLCYGLTIALSLPTVLLCHGLATALFLLTGLL